MRRTLLALPLALVAFGLAGCMDGEETQATPETVVGTLPEATTTAQTSTAPSLKGDPAAGKKVFQSAGCTGCHTLKDAGSTGTVGPNLDEAKPSQERAVDRVTNGQGAMPSFKGQLSDAQIQAVAKYVSSTAGK
jgi:mono/diheme cytochrome c family protein